MTVDWAIIATASSQQADGSLAILGAGTHTFFTVPRASLPLAMQTSMPPQAAGTPVQMSVIARLNANRSEAQQQHKIDTKIVDADGNLVVNSSVPMALNNDPNLPQGWPLIANVIMNVGLAIYPKYGEYGIDIVIDGDSKKFLRFRILPAPGTSPPAAQST
jgi:hypothetical protein